MKVDGYPVSVSGCVGDPVLEGSSWQAARLSFCRVGVRVQQVGSPAGEEVQVAMTRQNADFDALVPRRGIGMVPTVGRLHRRSFRDQDSRPRYVIYCETVQRMGLMNYVRTESARARGAKSLGPVHNLIDDATN